MQVLNLIKNDKLDDGRDREGCIFVYYNEDQERIIKNYLIKNVNFSI